MAKTSFTQVGNCADSPDLIHRPSPAAGYAAEILDGDDPDLGYDVELFSYNQEVSACRAVGMHGRNRKATPLQ
jgi:hypothetical protein